jgi:hypothetical protein
MSVIENLLDDAGVDPDEIIDEEDRSRANQTVGRNHDLNLREIEPPEPPTKFDLPSFGKEQFELLTSINLASGNPETGENESVFGVEIIAEDGDSEPVNRDVRLGVAVTDHLNTEKNRNKNFSDTPNDGLNGSTTVTFENGSGGFTIGGSERGDADLTLGFLGFLPEVNDVETIEITAPNNVEIVGRSIELAPDVTNEIAVASVQDSHGSTQEPEEGFTETIEERK